MSRICRFARHVAVAAAAIVAVASGHAADVFGQDFRRNNAVDFGPSWIQLTRSDATFYRASAFATKPLGLSPITSFEVKPATPPKRLPAGARDESSVRGCGYGRMTIARPAENAEA